MSDHAMPEHARFEGAEFPALEARLRSEAQLLAERPGKMVSAAGLLKENRRRAAVRRRKFAGAAALVVVCVGIGWRMRSTAAPVRPLAGDVPGSSVAVPREPAASSDPQWRPLESSDAVAAVLAPLSESSGVAEGAVLFLITDAQQAGEPVVAVGVYIPPRTQRVGLSDLPPLQQAAVRRVLELDEPRSKPTI